MLAWSHDCSGLEAISQGSQQLSQPAVHFFILCLKLWKQFSNKGLLISQKVNIILDEQHFSANTFST